MINVRIHAVAAALLLLAASAPAQIKLGLRVEPDTVLQYEPVMARLSILNNSGDELNLGSNGNCQVRYVIRDNVGSPTARLTKDTVARHELVVEPSMMIAVTNRLSDIYNLAVPGSYTVEVEVEWGGLVFSPKKQFVAVVPGITVGELEAGVPGGSGRRHYLLKVLSRDRQDRLFLRMDDKTEEVCLGVFDLGRYIRMEDPTLRLDGSGNLHILHQSGPYEHTYSAVSPSGQLDDRKVISGEYKVVRLKTMNDGAVVVHESATMEAPPPRPPESLSGLPGRKDRRSSAKE